MADLKIYNNGENKVLMSAGGRIIKQPYEVNEGFNNDVTPRCWFESEEPLPTNWGVIFYVGSLSSSDTGIFQAVSAELNLADNLVVRKDIYIPNIIDAVPGTQTAYLNPFSTRAVRYFHSTDVWWYAFLNGAALDFSNTLRTESVRSKIKIGASGHYLNNANITSSYLNGTILHRFIIVDRLLANSEAQYMHNNAIFADPQSKQGFLNEYIYTKDTLQIVNYQGVDVVGMTDLIGTRTLKLMGLPAGSLQEQLDWARANLYKPFPN